MTNGTISKTRSIYRKRSKPIPYRDRPFIAWDGEAYTGENGRSTYCLFGNSEGWELSSSRLAGMDCIRTIFEADRSHPFSIHVGFGLGFDINMLVCDFSRSEVQQLKTEGKVWIKSEGLLIEYLPKKWIRLYDSVNKQSVTIFDMFTFFMSSAMKAWEQYFVNDPELMLVVRRVGLGKEARDSFEYEELETTIRPYFREELQLYRLLMHRLRDLLAVAGIYPKGWYGPGAIANALLKERTDHLIQRDLPDGVIEASAYAYFGGRFEQFYTGQYKGPIYSYDIRSAYPHALRLCPDLGYGTWEHSSGFPKELHEFALYKVDFDYDRSGSPRLGFAHLPMPFPYRDDKGRVHYPARVRGWYWGCEVREALRWFNFRITESWVFRSTSESKPFQFLEDMYERRAKWKREGNQAQLALKLGLNSIYGKLAQRVGWNEEDFTPPKWHQLEYAGFATALCRSMIYSAMMQNPLSIVAVETDGVFSTSELSLNIGSKLGQWEEERYDGLIYVQSGVYFLSRWRKFRGHQWFKARTRGFGAKSVTVERAIESVEQLRPLVGSVHRFAGFNGYLWRDQWLNWIDRPQVALWGGNGKRAHAHRMCERCMGDTGAQLHNLAIARPWGGDSYPHFLPWREGLNVYQEIGDTVTDVGLHAFIGVED